MTLKPSAGRATELEWFKSSHSGSDNNDCVEVAAAPSTIYIRDSKDKEGARLTFATGPWADFVAYASGH